MRKTASTDQGPSGKGVEDMTAKFRSRLLPQGALIEFIPNGAYVKVCAVDPVTGEEVSIVGDPRSGSKRLGQEAVKKLEFILRRKHEEKAKARAAKSGAADPLVRARRSEPPSGWDM